jgi:hypothetical protein
MITDLYNSLFGYLTTLMTTQAGFFLPHSLILFKAIGTILLVIAGWRLATQQMSIGKFASLIVQIAICNIMLAFWTAPLPYAGTPFHRLFMDTSQALSSELSAASVADFHARCNQIYVGLQTPGWGVLFNFADALRYAVIVLLLMLCSAAVFGIIALAYIVQAICVIIGPLFISFYLVPKLDFIFWNWIKAFLQYSFLPLIAQIYIFVAASLLNGFVDRAGTDLAGARIVLVFFPLVVLLMAIVFGMMKIPSINNSLWTGRSGEGWLPF